MAELASAAELTALTDEASLTALGSGKIAVLFGADWDPPSQQLTQLLTEAANKKTYGTVKLATAGPSRRRRGRLPCRCLGR